MTCRRLPSSERWKMECTLAWLLSHWSPELQTRFSKSSSCLFVPHASLMLYPSRFLQRKRSLRKKTLSASIKARRQSHHQARKLEVEKNDSDCTHSSTKRVSFSGKLSICTFDKRVLPHQSKSSVGTACRLYYSKTESHRYCGIVGSPSGVVDDAGAAG